MFQNDPAARAGAAEGWARGRPSVGAPKEGPAFPPAKGALQGKLTLRDSRVRVDQHIAPAKKKGADEAAPEGKNKTW
jgi:hypothetical protein